MGRKVVDREFTGNNADNRYLPQPIVANH
jgi:hypothetical protein